MKRLLVAGTVFSLFAVASAAPARADGWELDKSHSSVGFSVRHLMVSEVRGEFRDFTLTLHADEKDITKSTVEVTIPIVGIDTRDEKRDAHLKTADFFDAEKHPTMVFKSKSITKAGKGKYRMKGDLTLHGVTKETTLDLEAPAKPVKSPWGTDVYGVQATGKINRKDFGITWNKVLDGGGLALGEEIRIAINVELVKKPVEEKKPAEQKHEDKKPEEKK